jgi:putative membrane protein
VPWLRIRLVPHRLRFQAAHANASRQFLTHNVHLTAARTGVLIFVSLAERYAEVVADSGIDSHVEQRVWDDVVDALTVNAGQGRLVDGFIEAIETVGAILAEHFPASPDDVDELDNRLVEI